MHNESSLRKHIGSCSMTEFDARFLGQLMAAEKTALWYGTEIENPNPLERYKIEVLQKHPFDEDENLDPREVDKIKKKYRGLYNLPVDQYKLRVPETLELSDRETMRTFLASFMECDAMVMGHKILVHSKSQELLNQVKSMLVVFGVESEVMRKDKRSFLLIVSGVNDIVNFQDEIGFFMHGPMPRLLRQLYVHIKSSPTFKDKE